MTPARADSSWNWMGRARLPTFRTLKNAATGRTISALKLPSITMRSDRKPRLLEMFGMRRWKTARTCSAPAMPAKAPHNAKALSM